MTHYEITKITHATLQATALRLGKEITLASTEGYLVKYQWMDGEEKIHWKYERLSVFKMCRGVKYHELSVIEAPQIRQILVAMHDVLGNDLRYEKAKSESVPNEENGYDPEYSFACDEDFYVRLTKHKPQKHFSLDDNAYGYISRAEALNNRWLGTLKPMFDTDPVAVLTELKELLENL